MIVHLANDARTDIVAPVEQFLLDLVLDDLAALFDDENLSRPTANSRTPSGSSGQGMPILYNRSPILAATSGVTPSSRSACLISS